ncbi:MAG: hypothetical protein U1G07_04565 [Verrucomicrobiota bacterium]
MAGLVVLGLTLGVNPRAMAAVSATAVVREFDSAKRPSGPVVSTLFQASVMIVLVLGTAMVGSLFSSDA